MGVDTGPGELVAGAGLGVGLSEAEIKPRPLHCTTEGIHELSAPERRCPRSPPRPCSSRSQSPSQSPGLAPSVHEVPLLTLTSAPQEAHCGVWSRTSWMILESRLLSQAGLRACVCRKCLIPRRPPSRLGWPAGRTWPRHVVIVITCSLGHNLAASWDTKLLSFSYPGACGRDR